MKINNINCQWMGLNIKSPFILASLTPFSHINIPKHIEFFQKGIDYGAGAIILPSINPTRQDTDSINKVFVETSIIESGLNKSSYMGFTLLGPTDPNLISTAYGYALAEEMVKIRKAPIIGSVANIGTDQEILKCIRQLVDSEVDGIELNFSCPNVLNIERNQKKSAALVPSVELIKNIRKFCRIPLSLKLAPSVEYNDILDLTNDIDNITISNAYTGLVPPNIDPEAISPFKLKEKWAPTGMYGPQERLLTYNRLYNYIKERKEGIHISCVGGIITGEHAIQALLLGADTVQLSSAIAWNGLSIFKKSNTCLREYLEKTKTNNVDSIKGKALAYIVNNADEAVNTSATLSRRMSVNKLQCRNCTECKCCDRLCFAFSKKEKELPVIDPELCSGCGWCKARCQYDAIMEERI